MEPICMKCRELFIPTYEGERRCKECKRQERKQARKSMNVKFGRLGKGAKSNGSGHEH